jgi:uncharacterized membrane protein YhhN
MLTSLLIVAVFLALLLLAHARESRLGVWLTKPVASMGFVALSLAGGALESLPGRVILGGQVLCLAGDTLLIPSSKKAFLTGMAAFLAGHLVFGFAFALHGLAYAGTLPAVFLLGLLAAVGLVWMKPHVSARMWFPVQAYTFVLSLMVALAWGATAYTGRPIFGVAATAFFISDIGVARNRFVSPGLVNRLWALPLYYAAQVLLSMAASMREGQAG